MLSQTVPSQLGQVLPFLRCQKAATNHASEKNPSAPVWQAVFSTSHGVAVYLLKLRLSDIADLETVLADTIKAQPGVVRTHTMIVLSSPKETAIIPCFGRTEEKP